MLLGISKVCIIWDLIDINSGVRVYFLVLELSQELTTFKTETARVQEIKRKLQFEKDKLSRELREFEQQRQTELKKIEEERRKLKRDKLLLDKVSKYQFQIF